MRYDHGEDVPSLDDLLAEAEEARAAGADVVEIEHGAKDGHPTSINIDYMKNAIDDGACYVISDYSERT
jgi:hypothetical protein